MTFNSTWVPDEDPQTLFSERCWLQGAVVSAIAYGVNLPLYFLSFYLLIQDRNHVGLRKRLPLLIYITVSFLLGTLYMIVVAAFTQMAFIDDRNYPGGPSSFESDMFSIPIDEAGNAAFVLSIWLSDALVVWRFKVIFQGCRFPMWVVMFFPYLMFAGSVATGIMSLIQDSSTNPYTTSSINFTLPFSVISLSLNIILTISIVLRLMRFRYTVVSTMGPHYGTHYTSIAAMIVESAALFSLTAIAFITLFSIGNAVSQVFLQSLNQIQTIAALLIIFRVANGKGWTEETATCFMAAPRQESPDLARMQFASPSVSITLARSTEEAAKTVECVEG